MTKFVLTLLAVGMLARAEVRTMTLREAVDRALKENPDLVIARLDLLNSQYAVKISKDPFRPKVTGGSGPPCTTAYPRSIIGQPPSIFESRAAMSIFTRPQAYSLAQARE